MRNKRYCAFFYGDILGYRELLQNTNVSDIEKVLRDSLSDVKNILNARQSDLDKRKVSLAGDPKDIAKVFQWSGEGRFHHYFAFDTLLVFLSDLSRRGLEMKLTDFMLFCSSIYLTLLTKHDIRLRGVVGLTSKYVIDHELVVFKELIKAYDLEKSQNWSGIVMDVRRRYLNFASVNFPSEDEFVYYKVPFKQGSREYPVLNPVNKYTVNFLRENSLSLSAVITRLKEESLQPGLHSDIKAKLENTVPFLRFCEQHFNRSIKVERYFGQGTKGFDNGVP